MSKINNLNEAILNIGKTRKNKYGDAKTNDIVYSRWDKYYSRTIGDFYEDFIKPRIPRPDVVLEWHRMLMKYCEMDGAIFPIRDGHTNAPDDKIKLRRGWLVRVDWDVPYDKRFSYTFTDNYFPAYIYKMALDGFCPTVDEFYEYMTDFQYPEDKNIEWLSGKTAEVKNPTNDRGEKRKFLRMPIRFDRAGKSTYPGSTETKKNAYINTSPAPSCQFGNYGYKHAHVFSVKGIESKKKDSKTQNELYNIDGKDIQWKNIGLVELGEECKGKTPDYTWDEEIENYSWHRSMKDAGEREALRRVVIAHFLRFCDPMNHFLSPMQGSNKFTKKNGDYSLDIGEYENLLSFLIFLREKEFGKDYENFKMAILAPSGMKSVDCSSEVINVIYHEDKQDAANKKSKAVSFSSSSSTTRTPSTKTKTSTTIGGSTKGKNSDKNYEIAAYYLRNQEGMSTVGTKFLPTPDPKGSKTKSRLKPIGVLGEHKGLLIHTSIDDAIANAVDPVFKNTLEEIKKRGLY